MLDVQTVSQAIIRERLGLTAYLFTVARNYHFAEDVFQETFIKATQRADRFESERHLINWFRVAGRNRAIDLIRSSEGRYTGLDDETLAALEADWNAVAAAEPSEAIDALASCIDELSERNRAIIRMRYFENQDCQTIATKIDRRIKAIYQSIFRIQKTLEQCVSRRIATQP